VSQSFYVPDECINPHPRFPTLTANIRKRRGEKVQMAVPIFQDANTEQTLSAQRQVLEGKVDVEGQERLPLDSIYLDCMAFGMGAGCLQMTFQARKPSCCAQLKPAPHAACQARVPTRGSRGGGGGGGLPGRGRAAPPPPPLPTVAPIHVPTVHSRSPTCARPRT